MSSLLVLILIFELKFGKASFGLSSLSRSGEW